MRTYTVSRKKKKGGVAVRYSLQGAGQTRQPEGQEAPNLSFDYKFEQGKQKFHDVPEVIAARVVADYPDEFELKPVDEPAEELADEPEFKTPLIPEDKPSKKETK